MDKLFDVGARTSQHIQYHILVIYWRRIKSMDNFVADHQSSAMEYSQGSLLVENKILDGVKL